MMKKSRKGFTIVELVIVIAVIAVLAAVLIPTFIHLVNKANKASDQSLVTNLNKALAMREAEPGDTKNNTMHDAVLDLEEEGYKLSQLLTKSDQSLLWNDLDNRFYLEEEADQGKLLNYWKIEKAVPQTQKYSIYAGHEWSGQAKGLTVGFDAGYNNLEEIEYKRNSTTQTVVIRSSGNACDFTVDAPNDNVKFYGYADSIDVKAVKDASLHIFGAAKELSVTAGHVEVEDTGIVFNLTANSGSVTNNGYIGEQTSGTAPTGKAVGGVYEIESVAKLESFRDVVNAGGDFAGKTARLTANLTLRDGWKPIGEGARIPAAGQPSTGNTLHTGSVFRGEFDGANHSISNLNNKGFVPTSKRIGYDDKLGDEYAYGLFGIVGSGANIHDLELTNVDIDTTRTSVAVGDSVGGLIGYSAGSLTLSNIKVSGSVKGYEAVAGVVGRSYPKRDEAVVAPSSTVVSITGCENKANVTAEWKVAGIVGYAARAAGATYTVSGCTNSGTITQLLSHGEEATYIDDIAVLRG